MNYRIRSRLGSWNHVCLLPAAFFLGLTLLGSGRCGGQSSELVVGSKNFTEQVILGEMLAQHLEKQLGLKVRRRLNIAGTFLCHQAVRTGEIDLYVEYTGTAFTGVLRFDPIRDRGAVYKRVKEAYRTQFNLEWTEPLGFDNTFALMVRGEVARRLGLRTISDAVRHAPGWKAGFGYEFLERADGFRGLVETYGLEFEERPREMDLGLMYRALRAGEVDLVAGNSTEGLIDALDLAVLKDDRRYFPPYEAAPVVNRTSLKEHPGLRSALAQLGGVLDEKQMRKLNYEIDGQRRDVGEVVRTFLESRGL